MVSKPVPAQSRFDNRLRDLVDAESAARFLGVRVSTLYTYVSRGWLVSVPLPGTRKRYYARSELQRLKRRHDSRSGHAPVAAAALEWGEPVIDSSITSVEGGVLSYRGVPVTELLAMGVSYEYVAELLWGNDAPSQVYPWEALSPRASRAPTFSSNTGPIAALSVAVAVLGANDPMKHGEGLEPELQRARRAICELAALPGWSPAKTERGRKKTSVASRLSSALGLSSNETARAVEQALIVMADHELNISTFAARVAASGRADLYGCLLSALGAFSGPDHGRATERVEALVDDAGSGRSVAKVIRERLARGERVVGFGHPLYPSGDPRTPPLLGAARALGWSSKDVRVVFAIVDVMRDAGHPEPNLDLGLVALRRALRAPVGTASAVFAIGRMAGWIAHVMEQRQRPGLLRPRARYVSGVA